MKSRKQWLREMAADLCEDAELFDGVEVKRLPMHAALRCRSCGHRGTALVPPGSKPSFRCSKCGSTLIAWHL